MHGPKSWEVAEHKALKPIRRIGTILDGRAAADDVVERDLAKQVVLCIRRRRRRRAVAKDGLVVTRTCHVRDAAHGSRRRRRRRLVVLAPLTLLTLPVLAPSRAAAEPFCLRCLGSHAKVAALQHEELDLPPHAIQATLIYCDHPAVNLWVGI